MRANECCHYPASFWNRVRLPSRLTVGLAHAHRERHFANDMETWRGICDSVFSVTVSAVCLVLHPTFVTFACAEEQNLCDLKERCAWHHFCGVVGHWVFPRVPKSRDSTFECFSLCSLHVRCPILASLSSFGAHHDGRMYVATFIRQVRETLVLETCSSPSSRNKVRVPNEWRI